MKKFTSLFVSLLIAFVSLAQNNQNMHLQIQRVHEKYLTISMKSDLMIKYSNRVHVNPKSMLKVGAIMQKLDSVVLRTLNTDIQVWENDSKDEYSYDSELNNKSWSSMTWDRQAKKWMISGSTELKFNKQSMVDTMYIYESEGINQTLMLLSKSLNFYNADGIQDSLYMYTKSSESEPWVLDMKQINHYNASNQIESAEMWASDEGVFAHVINVDFHYNVTGKLQSINTVYLIEGEEIPFSKTDYLYDGSGRISSMENSDLNFFTFEMEKSSRDTYEYNSNNDVTVDIYSSWNGTAWVEEDKDEMSYGTTNASEVAYPYYYSTFFIYEGPETTFNKIITEVKSYDKTNGEWRYSDQTTFYYSDAISSNIKEIGNASFAVYPNPASESISFNWTANFETLKLELYQITGAKAMEQIISKGFLVSISNLKNGVYFYNLLNENQTVHSGKVIKN